MAARFRRTAVALGSNVGDRAAHLRHAADRLGALLRDPVVSGFVDTAPHGAGSAGQPRFLNGAVVGWSADDPARLLARLHAIEAERGRRRPFPAAPRTLDLDLVLMGDLIVSAPGIELPHPRFRERRFVLAPLAAVAPDLVDPVTGMNVQALLDRLDC